MGRFLLLSLSGWWPVFSVLAGASRAGNSAAGNFFGGRKVAEFPFFSPYFLYGWAASSFLLCQGGRRHVLSSSALLPLEALPLAIFLVIGKSPENFWPLFSPQIKPLYGFLVVACPIRVLVLDVLWHFLYPPLGGYFRSLYSVIAVCGEYERGL